ncbi:MAG: fused MFS/spermidine synthase [Bacteroidetes bacterium]|nr:fused MFS/spermidine synthase [Bacteroidota bacterium]
MSYLFPIKIWKGSGDAHPNLELFLYRGQWQLATEDAIYSDGVRYSPMVKAFSQLRTQIPAWKKVLVLGGGAGSAARILRKMGSASEVLLVENDGQIIQLMESELPDENIRYVCEDAKTFIASNKIHFDVVVIDIFIGRKVPEFVSKDTFLAACQRACHKNGIVIINFMINDVPDSERFDAMVAHFTNYAVIDIGINKVVIVKV